MTKRCCVGESAEDAATTAASPPPSPPPSSGSSPSSATVVSVPVSVPRHAPYSDEAARVWYLPNFLGPDEALKVQSGCVKLRKKLKGDHSIAAGTDTLTSYTR